MRRRLLECVHADSSPRPPVSGEPRAPHSHRSRRPARLADWANYNVDPKFDTKQGVQIATVHAMLQDLPNALGAALVSAGGALPAAVAAQQADGEALAAE